MSLFFWGGLTSLSGIGVTQLSLHDADHAISVAVLEGVEGKGVANVNSEVGVDDIIKRSCVSNVVFSLILHFF